MVLRKTKINVPDEVLRSLALELAREKQAQGQQEVTPQKVRDAMNTHNWTRLKEIFETDDRFIRNYMGTSETDLRNQDALRIEIRELIEQSEPSSDLVDFIAYYYKKAFIDPDDIPVIASRRFDDAGFPVKSSIFMTFRQELDGKSCAQALTAATSANNAIGENLIQMTVDAFGRSISGLGSSDAQEAFVGFDSLAEYGSDWLAYEFLQNFKDHCHLLTVTQAQFQKLLENSMNGTAALVLHNGQYEPTFEDMLVAIAYLDKRSKNGFDSNTGFDSQTNLVIEIANQHPSIWDGHSEDIIKALFDQAIENPHASPARNALCHLLITKWNGEILQLQPLLLSRTKELDNDWMYTILMDHDLYTPSQDEMDAHIEKSQFHTVLASISKGNMLTESQFGKILDSNEEPFYIARTQIDQGYIPTPEHVARFSPQLRQTFASRLEKNGIDVSSHVSQALTALGSSPGTAFTR